MKFRIFIPNTHKMNLNEEDFDGPSCLIFCVNGNEQTTSYIAACVDECHHSEMPLLCQYKCTFNLMGDETIPQLYQAAISCRTSDLSCFVRDYIPTDNLIISPEKYFKCSHISFDSDIAIGSDIANTEFAKHCLLETNGTEYPAEILQSASGCEALCGETAPSRCFTECLAGSEKGNQVTLILNTISL